MVGNNKCNCLLQVIEIIRNPKRNKLLEIRSMTESVVGKEEEERHQKLVTENEQLKRQIEEVKLFEPRHEKTNILVSDLVGHKPGCAVTEDG